MCNAPVDVTQNYVCYRNRLIDTSNIVNFHTKGKRLLINSYRQNDSYPTMLVMFSSKEDAKNAFEKMKSIFYESNQYKVTHSTIVEPLPPLPVYASPAGNPTESIIKAEDSISAKSLDLFLTGAISLFSLAVLFMVYRV